MGERAVLAEGPLSQGGLDPRFGHDDTGISTQLRQRAPLRHAGRHVLPQGQSRSARDVGAVRSLSAHGAVRCKRKGTSYGREGGQISPRVRGRRRCRKVRRHLCGHAGSVGNGGNGFARLLYPRLRGGIHRLRRDDRQRNGNGTCELGALRLEARPKERRRVGCEPARLPKGRKRGRHRKDIRKLQAYFPQSERGGEDKRAYGRRRAYRSHERKRDDGDPCIRARRQRLPCGRDAALHRKERARQQRCYARYRHGEGRRQGILGCEAFGGGEQRCRMVRESSGRSIHGARFGERDLPREQGIYGGRRGRDGAGDRYSLRLGVYGKRGIEEGRLGDRARLQPIPRGHEQIGYRLFRNDVIPLSRRR